MHAGMRALGDHLMLQRHHWVMMHPCAAQELIPLELDTRLDRFHVSCSLPVRPNPCYVSCPNPLSHVLFRDSQAWAIICVCAAPAECTLHKQMRSETDPDQRLRGTARGVCLPVLGGRAMADLPRCPCGTRRGWPPLQQGATTLSAAHTLCASAPIAGVSCADGGRLQQEQPC